MRKIGLKDFFNYKCISSLTLSPEGDKLAYIVSSVNEEDNDYDSNLFMMRRDAAGKNWQEVQLVADGKAGEFFFEDNDTILFQAKRGKDQKKGEEAPITVGIEKNGMITYDRRTNPIPWNKLGADYETMPPVSGLVGTHWPNFLHEDPERNLENVERAEAYFRRCGARFESVLSRDVVFFVTQAMYRRFAKSEEEGSALTVDLSAVPNVEGLGDRFYINSKQPIKFAEGCTATVYETHPTHTVYEIKPQTSLLRLFV
jgi:hypothetical protein